MRTTTVALLALLASCGSDDNTSQGALGQLCYPNGTCNAGLTCTPQGTCAATQGAQGGEGQLCFPNNTCNTGLTCNAQGTCAFAAQGGQGQPCRPGGGCDAGLTCDPQTQRCTPPSGGTGDCREASLSCSPPFVCRADEDTGKLGCRSPVGDVPTCSGSPSGQVVPFSTTDQNKPQHWTLGQGCIPTSYDSFVAARSTEIAAALKAWTDVACSRLCFSPPVANDTAPAEGRAERRLHFRLATTDDPQLGVQALTNTVFEQSTGRIITAGVIVIEANEIQPSDWLQLVGYAIGLAQAPNNAASVMAPLSNPRAHTTLTAADQTAICALYGTPSYCGD